MNRPVFVRRKLFEVVVNVIRIDGDRGTGHFRGSKRNTLQQPLHDRVQAPCTDVLGTFIHLPC